MLHIQQKGYFQSIKQFHIFEQKQLGTGSFGIVKLAVHVKTCKIYAIKIINLKLFSSESQYKLIERQVRLHSQIDHPHIIKFWDAFAQNDQLYMVLEYAERGNLFYYQNTRTIFPQLEGFKYFYQTAQALKFLHTKNIIHRDLKPENLLLDTEYNIKLCDFGWGTQRVSMKRTTFCGTYEYMAPQMLFQNQYDEKIDIWALGILLYEMLHGVAPFKGQSASEVKQKMVIGSYTISSHLSTQCRDIIVSLLKFSPGDRITFEELQNHPWSIKMSESLAQQYFNNQSSRNIYQEKEQKTQYKSFNSYTTFTDKYEGNSKNMIKSATTKKIIIQATRDKPNNLSATTMTNIVRKDQSANLRGDLTERNQSSKKSITKRYATQINHQLNYSLNDRNLKSQKKRSPGTKKTRKKSKPKNDLQKGKNDYLSKAEIQKNLKGKSKSKSKSKSKDKEKERTKSSKKMHQHGHLKMSNLNMQQSHRIK